MQDLQKFFDMLEKQGTPIPEKYRRNIEDRLNSVLSYQPRVGIFGKTGAGKSSLCNAVFGQDICEISDIDACTRSPQEIILSMGRKGVKLIDVPGVGESRERDKEYAELYKNLLPELDIVLWVLKGDDRAFSSDEQFYTALVKPYISVGLPFLVVLNQVDKIEPYFEWDREARRPSQKQVHNIDEKRKVVASKFDLSIAHVIPVSANEKYGLVELVDQVVHSLPNDKKVIVLKNVKPENQSEGAREEASDGIFQTFIKIVVDVVPAVIEAGKVIYEVAKSVLGFFLPWRR